MADRTPGIYVRLDASYDMDEAIWMAGPMAELLFLRSLAYSKRKQTDGFIPEMALVVIGARIDADLAVLADRLVTAELWIKSDEPCGWHVTGWDKWQMTTTEVSDRRTRNRNNALTRHHGEGRHDSEAHPECPICASGMQVACEPHTTKTPDPRPQTPSAATRSRGNPGSSSHQGCKRPGCNFGFIDREDRSGVIPCPGYISEAS